MQSALQFVYFNLRFTLHGMIICVVCFSNHISVVLVKCVCEHVVTGMLVLCLKSITDWIISVMCM